MDVKNIIEYIKSNREFLANNRKIFEILEGDLQKYVKASIERQITSADSSRLALERSAPINVLKKIVNKLSKLYSMPINRETENPNDAELLDWYENETDINVDFQDANESFNAYKTAALEIFESEGMVKTRSLPAHQYIAYSDDDSDPMKVTHFVKIMPHGNDKVKFWIYTDEFFMPVDEDGNVIQSDLGDTEGLNPYGVIPFSYLTKSRYLLTPMSDTDTLRLSLLLPVLLTDLNFASMMLSNPILYTIDADGSNISINPNMYWDLKSDDSGVKPEVGVIKPEPNIAAQLQLIKEELAFWLQTKNIKPGAIGNLTVDNASSGISLMIQEMDTTEDRRLQEVYFQKMESDYWYRLAVIHNYFAKNGEIENRQVFSNPEELKVRVEYAKELVIETRAETVARLDLEVKAGFTSKRNAIEQLNPKMNEEEIDALLEEMDEPITLRMEDATTEGDDTNTEELEA